MSVRCLLRRAAGVFALALVCSADPAFAAPYVPSDPGAVLERLPRAVTGERVALRALRARLAQQPDNLSLALELAERYVRLGRVESEPRFFGHAEGVLRPWFAEAEPMPAVRVMRATLAQHHHDFARANADLEAAVAAAPDDPRAWLTLATIARVQGRLDAAADACNRLARVTPLLVSFTCAADVASLRGQARESHAGLSALWRSAGSTDPDVRLWVLTVLAESAARAEAPAMAEAHFREAIDAGPRDANLLAAYADFLLEQQRPADVRRLLAEETRSDALLLRLAIAERRLGDPAWERHRRTLATRIDASRERGDRMHLREEALHMLALADDPAAALQLAQENWEQQREPTDARLLLEAALAARRPVAARPVQDWLAETGLRDPVLSRLVRQIEEMPA